MPPTSSRPGGAGPLKIGKYVVVARLGAGAFGTVYRAHDPQLRRDVALKVPHPGSLANPRKAARVLREARAAAVLRHENIVKVHDILEDPDHHLVIVSEFVEGGSLADAIDEEGMDLRRAADIVRRLALAVAHAHEQGIVHRDIKPSNLLLDARDQPYLVDFGLAAQADESAKLTNMGAVVGTPAYMAPEQAAGHTGSASPASDQYSLGVVLYELLTGRVPFEGPPAVVIYSVLHSDVPAPRSLRDAVPAALEAICLRAMARETTERFADCWEFAEALDVWLKGQADTATLALPSAKRAPAPRPRRRWPWVAAGAVLLAGVAVAVAVLAQPRGREHGATGDAAAPPPTAPEKKQPDPAATPPNPEAPKFDRKAEVWGPLKWRAEGKELFAKGVRMGGVAFGNPAWKGCDVAMEMRCDHPDGSFGIEVRRTGNRSLFLFIVMSRSLRVHPFYDGPAAEAKDFTPFALKPNVWYALLVSCRGPKFEFGVTELSKAPNRFSRVVEYTDGRNQSGKVGIRVGVPGNPVDTEYRVRNIRVIGPGGKDLWPEGPPELP